MWFLYRKTVARREFDSLGKILILAAGLAGGPKIENQVCGVSGCGKIRNMISNVWRGSDRCPDQRVPMISRCWLKNWRRCISPLWEMSVENFLSDLNTSGSIEVIELIANTRIRLRQCCCDST